MAGNLTEFQEAYELSPIILNGGLAQNLPEQMMQITALTEPSGTAGLAMEDYFAHYKVLPGGTLAEWQYAEYPFSSMVMAANAAIQMPLKISLTMICPVKSSGGYLTKSSILTALQNQIQAHILSGGYFTVLTPGYTYSNCLLSTLRDISSPSDKNVQFVFQWDFTQPLITSQGAQQVVSNFTSRVGGGLPTPVTWNQTAQ